MEKGYRTISSLRKINNSIRVELIPDELKQGGIKKGKATYYPEETINKILDYFFNVPKEEKIKRTNLKRYGVENQFQRVEKIKESNLKKYGVEFPSKTKEVKEKTKQTNLKRYGVESPMQLEEIKEKMKRTNRKNHNGKFNSQTEEYLKKRTETWKSKYGVENISQLGLNQTKKIKFDGLYFDSKWEVYYYFYLKYNNIPFEYHPKLKLEYTFNNKTCRYLPDFKVYNRLVEIKGNHFFDKEGNLINPFKDDNGKSKAKQLCMEENEVLVLKEADILPYKKFFQLNSHL